MEYFRSLGISLSVLLLCLAVGAQAARAPVRFGVYGNFPPWIITDGDTLSGIEIDIMRQLAKRLEWEVDYVNCPWARCMTMLEEGNLDVMGSLQRTPARGAKLHYIPPSYLPANPIRFYCLPDVCESLNGYEDLRELTIGVIARTYYFEPFDSDDSLKKRLAVYDDQLWEMLLNGRIQVTLGAQSYGDTIIAKPGYRGRIVSAAYQPQTVALYLVISRLSPYAEQRQRLADALQALLDSGELAEIFRRHGEEFQPATVR